MNIRKKNGGQALLVSLLFFAVAVTSLLVGVSYSETKDISDVRASGTSKQSYFASESALEDNLYRLKTVKTSSSADVVSIGSAVATSSFGGIPSNQVQTIVSTSNNNNYDRDTTVSLVSGTSLNLPYAAQVGTGGLNLIGGSSITGNVYSDGPIIADWSCPIIGSATAASVAPYVLDQHNDSPTTPPQSIVFSKTSSTQDFAQSFMPATSTAFMKVSLYIEKTGSPSNITLRIVADNNGVPGTTDIADGSLSASSVTTNYGWVDVLLSSNPQLVVGSTYWIVLDSNSNSTSNYYTIGANSSYVSGVGKLGIYKGSWSNTSPSGLDGYFRTYNGGSFISGPSGAQSAFDIGTGGVGDAYADTIESVDAAGNIYCQGGLLNDESCNTSKPSPLEVSLPVTSAMISTWESDATNGTSTATDVHIGPWPNQNVAMGPAKINGNLIVDSGGTLTLTGTMYVTGNVSISGGGSVSLSPSYGTNDDVIVADGTISVGSGSSVNGSGAAGSYTMLLSNSNSNPAITINGGSNAVIANAQNGGVIISGGATANDVVGKNVTVEGGSQVIYQSAIGSNNFIDSSSTSSTISGWQEVP